MNLAPQTEASGLPSVTGVNYGSNYLSIDSDLPFKDFQSVWGTLVGIHGACPWWIGDAILQGEQAYGETYAQAIDVTDLKYDTLSKYRRTAQYFEKRNRFLNLSFTHHLNALHAPDADRQELLQRAQDESWSTRDVLAEAKLLKQRDGAIEGTVEEKGPTFEATFRASREDNDYMVWEVLDNREVLVARFYNRDTPGWAGKSVSEWYYGFFRDALREEGIAK